MPSLCLLKSSTDDEAMATIVAALKKNLSLMDLVPVRLPHRCEEEQSAWFANFMKDYCANNPPLSLVIVAGGDGTVQISLKGLIEHAQHHNQSQIPELCILPFGTGNLVAENLAIPSELDHSDYLASDYEHITIPIAQGNDHYFMLLGGLGATPEVMAETRPILKRLFGIWAYLYTGIRIFLCSPHRRYRLVTPTGDRHYYAKAIIISHTATYLGPFMPLIPSADAEKPEFTISIIAFPGIRDHIRLLKDLLRPTEKFSFKSTVQSFTTPEAIIHMEDQSKKTPPVQLDGNLLGTLPLSIRFSPYSAKVRVPKDAPAYLRQGRQGISHRHSVESDLPQL